MAISECQIKVMFLNLTVVEIESTYVVFGCISTNYGHSYCTFFNRTIKLTKISEMVDKIDN